MDKVIWGSSQGITSALYFLIQLSFLKSDNLGVMAEFSVLFGLMNFFLLMVRRSLIEVNDITLSPPSVGFINLLTLLFLLITMPISIAMHGNFFILICVAIFLFNQIVFDVLRFSNNRSHVHYLILQTLSIFLIVGTTLLGLDAIRQLLLVTTFHFFCSVFFLLLDRRKRINFKQTISFLNFTRLLDFIISSGFGFFLPLLTVLALDNKSVGILRTSQNFLSLGSIFTAAFYYSSLKETKNISQFRFLYFLPSLILFGLLFCSKLIVSDMVLRQVFGPYFQQSQVLTFLLILALVPTMWVSGLNAIMVKIAEFGTLFKIHLISFSFLACGSLGGFQFLGIESFGLVTILCACLEIFLVKRTLRSRND